MEAAPPRDDPPERPAGRRFRWLKVTLIGLGVLVGAVYLGIAGLTRTGHLHFYVIPSASMSPTIHCGDHLAVMPYGDGNPQAGDVIVYHQRADLGRALFVKRVVGLPHDRVEIHSDRVWVNGRRLDDAPTSGDMATHTVGANAYFVLGDNRGISDDSRFEGDVPRDAILGKAVAIYWPISHVGGIAGSAPAQPGPGC